MAVINKWMKLFENAIHLFFERKPKMKQLIALLIWTAVASAHSGDRLYPIYELTDEMLGTIDLHDGLIDEWYEIGEPSMTLLDFQTLGNLIPPEPSNLDFRIWLAWHDESNRIYAAFIIIDDEYNNTHNYTEDNNASVLLFDSVLFNIDADHSHSSNSKRPYVGQPNQSGPFPNLV